MTRIGPKQPEPTGRPKQINPRRELLENSELVGGVAGPVFSRTLGTKASLKGRVTRQAPKKGGTNKAANAMQRHQNNRAFMTRVAPHTK